MKIAIAKIGDRWHFAEKPLCELDSENGSYGVVYEHNGVIVGFKISKQEISKLIKPRKVEKKKI